MGLEAAIDAFDQLTEDGSDYSDPESIEALHRFLARVESFVTAQTATFDVAGNWEPDGAQNAASWLVTRTHLPRPVAKRMIRRGRHLRHLPACAEAWAAGDITGAQVDLMAGLQTCTTEVALARDEEFLVTKASTLSYANFEKVTKYWMQHADPDGVEDDAEKAKGRRQVSLVQSYGGMYFGQMTLDPISGAIVEKELERLEHEFFQSDWADARADLGRDPRPADLARTPGQRRADALVEMATRSLMASSDAKRPGFLLTVLCGYETLHGRVCELANGTVVTPGSLLPLLTEAYVERAVYTPSGRVEVSEKARLFTGGTRRAIEVRDRECTHPYCDVRASDAEVDHIIPFSFGGATVQENGRILCSFHNRLRLKRSPPDDPPAHQPSDGLAFHQPSDEELFEETRHELADLIRRGVLESGESWDPDEDPNGNWDWDLQWEWERARDREWTNVGA